MCSMAPELAHALTALDPADLGARIKAARVAAGLTQPELAGSDVSVAYLSRIESGQRRRRRRAPRARSRSGWA